MAVRSRRFFGPTSVTNQTTTLYTVPSGRTARFSLITVHVTGSGTGNGFIRVNFSGSGTVHQFVGQSGGFLNLAILQGLVLNPADVLYCVAPVNVTALVSGFGSLLLGEPE